MQSANELKYRFLALPQKYISNFKIMELSTIREKNTVLVKNKIACSQQQIY